MKIEWKKIAATIHRAELPHGAHMQVAGDDEGGWVGRVVASTGVIMAETGKMLWMELARQAVEARLAHLLLDKGLEAERYYFTFGYRYDHEPHPTLGTIDRSKHLQVRGVDREMARRIVAGMTSEEYGGAPMFAFDYPDPPSEAEPFMVITVERV